MRKEPLFKIGPYWISTVSGSPQLYYFWYDTRTREVRRRSLKTNDLEDAKLTLAALTIAEGKTEAREPGDVTLITVLNKYWTEHSDERGNPSAARRAGTLLLDFLGNAARVSEIEDRQEGFIKHLHGLGLSVAYISRVQSIIAAALNRATRKRHGKMLLHAPEIIVPVSEIAAILDAPEPEPRNWHPTLPQIAAHMDAAENTDVLRMTLLTVIFAGRPEAIAEARTDQFDARHKLIAWCAKGQRQTKKYRPTVPVAPSLAPHMEQWANEGGRFITKPVRGPWRRTCEATGVKFAPQALRHFMATEMRKRKVLAEDREEYMGHRRRSTNDHYGIFDPDWLRGPRDVAETLLSELESLCKLSIYRQVSAKPKRSQIRGDGGKFIRYNANPVVGATGIEPVTPAMSTHRKDPKVA